MNVATFGDKCTDNFGRQASHNSAHIILDRNVNKHLQLLSRGRQRPVLAQKVSCCVNKVPRIECSTCNITNMFDCWAGQVVFIFALKWFGCGTVVRTFTSDSRGLSFESGRWLFLNKTCQQLF